MIGCQGGSRLVERLDTRSGLTFVSEAQAQVFARTESRYSRSARDYVYIGPVETNERGTREYFLWVGIASTLDRGYVAPETETFVPEVLYANVQDEVMAFELRPLSERIPRLASIKFYNPAVKLTTELAARVTVEQLALLSNESPAQIRIGLVNGQTLDFYLWEKSPGWPDFLRHAAEFSAAAGR